MFIGCTNHWQEEFHSISHFRISQRLQKYFIPTKERIFKKHHLLNKLNEQSIHILPDPTFLHIVHAIRKRNILVSHIF